MPSDPIRLRYLPLAELAHLPLDAEDWLSSREREELVRLRDAGRRREWLGGRFAAKRLLWEELGGRASRDLASVEILSRDRQGRAVRPVVHVEGEPLRRSLSVAHSDRGVLIALAAAPGISVGVDLTKIEEVKPAALVFWFTHREQTALRLHRPRRAALCWAVKEAAYKALNRGESFVPRRIEVFRSAGGRFACTYDGQDPGPLEVRTWDEDGHIAAAAVAGLPASRRRSSHETRLRRARAAAEFAEAAAEVCAAPVLLER